MNVRRHAFVPLLGLGVIAFTWGPLSVGHLAGQGAAPVLTVVSRDARRTIPLATVGGQEMVALDDLAATFQVTTREEAGALTVSYKGRTIVLTPDQTIVSVAGRVISLPASPVRIGNRWLVHVDFIGRALGGIYDARIEVRRASHLVVVGDLRVPRLSVRQEASGEGARVIVDIAPRASTAVAQENRDRLTIRFDADALDVTFPSGQVPGAVLGYRSIDATSIAIDLGPRIISFRTATQASDASSSLVIDLVSQTEAPPAPTVTRVDTPPAPAAAPPTLPTLAVAGAGLRTIVIDPGHGGDDRGTRGVEGSAEKDLTLAIARRLKASIESRLGIRVVMTRDDDRSVAVTDRTALANNNKADLFISLHANGSFRPDVTGAAIYVASFEDGAIDPGVLVPERLPAFGGGFRDIELVPWNLAQIRYKGQSEALAATIARQFADHVPLAARPVEHAPLRVLESANMPAVLIEAGFLTNPQQEKLLGSNLFQSSLTDAVVEAIVRFRDAGRSGEGAAP